MTGDPQTAKRSKPILGMLQTSKALLSQKFENQDYTVDGMTDINNQHLFDTINEDNVAALNHAADKNPIINKRILLKVNYEQPINIETDSIPNDLEINLNAVPNKDDVKQTINAKPYKSESFGAIEMENIIYDKMKVMKPYTSTAAILNSEINPNKEQEQHSNEGRIVVYGDSNCLDSTHIEKPCFWLLDAFLEYTMTSHISKILKDLNRSSNIQFAKNSAAIPMRLPNNNLHMYSKVLQPSNGENDGQSKIHTQVKRPLPVCNKLKWETPIYLNITAVNDFNQLIGRKKDDLNSEDSNMMSELNLRRKLESRKGEVCSVQFEYSNVGLLFTQGDRSIFCDYVTSIHNSFVA